MIKKLLQQFLLENRRTFFFEFMTSIAVFSFTMYFFLKNTEYAIFAVMIGFFLAISENNRLAKQWRKTSFSLLPVSATKFYFANFLYSALKVSFFIGWAFSLMTVFSQVKYASPLLVSGPNNTTSPFHYGSFALLVLYAFLMVSLMWQWLVIATNSLVNPRLNRFQGIIKALMVVIWLVIVSFLTHGVEALANFDRLYTLQKSFTITIATVHFSPMSIGLDLLLAIFYSTTSIWLFKNRLERGSRN